MSWVSKYMQMAKQIDIKLIETLTIRSGVIILGQFSNRKECVALEHDIVTTN